MDGELFNFDDDIFDAENTDENHIVGTEHEIITFEPRQPKWFTSTSFHPSERDNFGMIMKFKGDLAYKEMNYKDALTHYKQFRDHIKDVNNSLWRASEEDIARCYVKMGRFNEALNCAQNLESSACNIDHITCSSNLYMDIFENMKCKSHKKLISIKKLLLIHPSLSSAWLALGQYTVCDNVSQEWAMTSFSICILLEKRKTCHSFVSEASTRTMEKAMNHLREISKDNAHLDSYIESVKTKYASLIDVDRHSLVSIEHWSSDYLEILKDDSLAEKAFNKKWMENIDDCQTLNVCLQIKS